MPRSGATAMKHAYATLVSLGYPLVLKSGKRIVRKPDGSMFALAEDIFSAFDLMGVSAAARPRFVQVTSQTRSRSTVAARQRKIEENFLAPLLARYVAREEDPRFFDVEVWSWVDRTGFRVWRWTCDLVVGPKILKAWRELPALPSPLLKPRSTAPRAKREPTANPFD
jgi:hypothetical protein